MTIFVYKCLTILKTPNKVFGLCNFDEIGWIMSVGNLVECYSRLKAALTSYLVMACRAVTMDMAKNIPLKIRLPNIPRRLNNTSFIDYFR